MDKLSLISLKLETADLFTEGVWVGKMPLSDEQFCSSGSTLRSKVKQIMSREFKNANKRSTMAKSILWNYIPVGCDKAILGEIKYNGGIKIICEEIKDCLTDKHRQQAIDYLQKIYDNLNGPNGKNERFNQAAVKAVISDAKSGINILKNFTLKEASEDVIEEGIFDIPIIGRYIKGITTNSSQYPQAALNYTGPTFTLSNLNTYIAAKCIYDSLSEEEKKFVCPNGRFVDSPKLVKRRVMGMYDPKNKTRGIPFAFYELYSFKPRTLELIVAVRPEFRGDHAALQLVGEALDYSLSNAEYDTLIIRVDNKNTVMKSFMNAKTDPKSEALKIKNSGGKTEYIFNVITPIYPAESALHYMGHTMMESEIIVGEATQPYKSYPNTYIGQKIVAGGENIERPLIKYIMEAERINKTSEAFRQIQNDIKTRQTSAILYRVLMMPNVILAMDTKELPASFKVFRAADVRASNKEPKIFVDVTGIVKLNNGVFICTKIDTLITYLTAALVQLLYYDPSKQLVNNASITRPATSCFVKLFTGVIDELRVIGYAENQLKIKYCVAVYFLTSLVGKPLENARSMAANILGINPREAKAYDYFYEDEALENLNTFVTDLCKNFSLRGFGTDIMLDRWMFKYGKGTMYGLELYPSFLTMLTNAYCGAYVNNQKTIEKYCGKDMVTISTTLIRVGADVYSEGAKYVRNEYGEIELK